MYMLPLPLCASYRPGYPSYGQPHPQMPLEMAFVGQQHHCLHNILLLVSFFVCRTSRSPPLFSSSPVPELRVSFLIEVT